MAQVPAISLSEHETLVARLLARGMDFLSVSTETGLTEGTVISIASRPHVEAEVYRLQQKALQPLASLAIKRLRVILKAASTNLAERKLQLDAAKVVLDRTGHGAAGSGSAAAGGKRTSELSLDQIQQALNEMKVKASDAAKVIDVTPNEAPDNAQPATQDIDIFS